MFISYVLLGLPCNLFPPALLTKPVFLIVSSTYEVVSKSFRTGRLARELQMVQLSATRHSCIAIL